MLERGSRFRSKFETGLSYQASSLPIAVAHLNHGKEMCSILHSHNSRPSVVSSAILAGRLVQL
jgi:hypothetical protein